MLTISKPLSASQTRTYHAREFAAQEQNYWSRDQQGHSEWRGRFAEQCPRVVVCLKQGLGSRPELAGPCLGSRRVGRCTPLEHGAVLAKLPYEPGHPEVVVAPGLECESVEFSLVHAGTALTRDPPQPHL